MVLFVTLVSLETLKKWKKVKKSKKISLKVKKRAFNAPVNEYTCNRLYDIPFLLITIENKFPDKNFVKDLSRFQK